MSNTCNCGFFHEGDWVECKLNTDLFGIVVGDSDYGRFINVQLAVTLEIKRFHVMTLQHMEDDTAPTPKTDAEEPETNVVHVDFTIARDLRNTKPAGRA